MSSARVHDVILACGVKDAPKSAATQENAIIKDILRQSKFSHFLGSSVKNEVEVDQWLSFSFTAAPFTLDHAKRVDSFLSNRSFLAGNQLTVADVSVFLLVETNQDWISAGLKNLMRWFAHIQHSLKRPSSIPLIRTNTELPLALFAAAPSAASVGVGVAATQKEGMVVATAVPSSGDKKKDGKEKKTLTVSAAAPPAAAPAELDPSKLDIKCGIIVKCWEHPDSDKLLCEEIDLGEGSTRQIASGLRPLYTAKEMEGKKVLVMANLKERKIGGFSSQGMVLCASNAEHTAIKLLEPPANANPGDRVIFTGFDGEPATPAQMVKKKILEGLLPLLRTNSKGVATWNGAAFTIGSNTVSAPMFDAQIS